MEGHKLNFKNLIIIFILITILAALITSVLIVNQRLNSMNSIPSSNQPFALETNEPTVVDKELYKTYHNNVQDYNYLHLYF